MKTPFEVWDYHFPTKGLHPVVLISHPDICARAQHINFLFCTSQRQSRQPYPYEVMLDTADGLNWETFCDCSVIYLGEAAALIHQRGHVCLERRLTIRTKLKEFFRLSATD
jgi:hypothetical protein